MAETIEKIIGMKVVNGKIVWLTSQAEIPDEASDDEREAMLRAQDLLKGTYTTKIMRPAKAKGQS